MGGGSSSPLGAEAPYDLLNSTYSSFSGGTPSGVNWYGVGSDIGAAGQSFAKVMQYGQTPVPSGAGGAQFPQTPVQSYAQQTPAYIPQGGMQDVIMRILGGMY